MATPVSHKRPTVTTIVGITATSEPIIGVVNGSKIRIRPTAAGSAKVQYTLNPIADIVADTATWYDWTPGAVAVATVETVSGDHSGARVVATTGTWVIELVDCAP